MIWLAEKFHIILYEGKSSSTGFPMKYDDGGIWASGTSRLPTSQKGFSLGDPNRSL